MKVLLLLRNLDSQKPLILGASDVLAKWASSVTNGGFTFEFEIRETNAFFSEVSGQLIMGTVNVVVNGTYIDPKQVVAAAAGAPCDIVALLYNNVDYPNANSLHAPLIQDGKTSIQLAISSSANQPGIIENLAHELLHACYFLASQKGANLVDDVHQHGGIDDPRASANYSDILLKLKPYWPVLTATQDKQTLIRSLQLKAISLMQMLIVKLQAQIEAQKKTQ